MGTLARSSRPVRLVWELKTPASLEDTWAAFADTDRFNRAAGLGFWFEERPGPEGTVARTGHMRRLGMHLTWDEHPFQYRAPEWYRSVRRFHGGPGLELVTTLRLKPDGRGTQIRYSIEVTPRSILFRPLVAFELHLLTRPGIDRALKGLLGVLEGRAVPYDPSPPTLSRDAEARVTAMTARLHSAKMASSLPQFLRRAPLAEQDRIQPLRMAKRWGIDEREALRDFLAAAREGVLAVRWEVICPSCRAPKQRLERLEDFGQKAHCDSCNIQFDASFPDSVEVSFRPAPSIRDFDLQTACLGSPARTPHIVAQDTVPPGEAVEFSLYFMPGPYRIRSFPPRDGCSLEAVEDAGTDAVAASVGPFRFDPARARIEPGPGRLTVKNVTDRSPQVIVERHWRPGDLLTAGRLLELPGARDLLPDGALIPGFEVETVRAGVLAVDAGTRERATALEAALAAYSPRRLQARAEEVVATFATFADALSAARDLAAVTEVRCALSAGPLVEVQLADRRVPMGGPIDEALAVLRGASGGVLAIPGRLAADPDVLTALRDESVTLWAPPDRSPEAPAVQWLSFERS